MSEGGAALGHSLAMLSARARLANGALDREAELVYETRPDEGAKGREPFSYDFSFNAYPLSYGRMGPEVRIYRLRGDRC